MTAQPAPDPRISAYAPVVANMLPQCSGPELELRCRLLLARDVATKALARCSDAEAGLLGEIERLGHLHAFAPHDEAALSHLLRAQRFMLRAAACLGEFVDGGVG